CAVLGGERRAGRFCAVGLAGASHGAASATTTRTSVNARPQRPAPPCFRKSWRPLIRGEPSDPQAHIPDPLSDLRIHRKLRSEGCSPAVADNRAPEWPARQGGRLRARKKVIR